MSKAKIDSFSIKFGNSKLLKGVTETLASIIDETKIKVDKQKFSIKAMDPSRICLLEFSMKKENFDDFTCKKSSEVGLNLEDLNKIIKRASSKDTIQLSFNAPDQKVKFIIENEDTKRTRTFYLTALDLDIENVPLDNLLKIDFDSTWKISPDYFIEALKDGEIFSDMLNIELSEELGLTFSSQGQIGEMEYNMSLDDFIESSINSKATGTYSIAFLKRIMKLNSIIETLEVGLKTDHPMKLKFILLESAELNYFLAPRVPEQEFEDDDDDIEEVD